MDDSDEDRYLLRRFLKKTGLSLVVLEASNGMDGMDLLTRPLEETLAECPDITSPVVLFLDINMPVMNGWEFVEELEKRSSEINIKPLVIFMHSTGDSQYESKKIEDFKFVAGYIVKGESTPDNLKQSILNAVSGAAT